MGTWDNDGPLRRITDSAGVGFCYAVDRELFAAAVDYGPLLIAWDANVLIDFHMHGAAAMSDEPLGVANAQYEADLYALADLIHLWFIRDIRFLSLPHGEEEFAAATHPQQHRNGVAIAALAEALTFQWFVGLYEPEERRTVDGPLRWLVDEDGTPAAAVVLARRVLRGGDRS